jgi:phospholipid/cholesterol/gamma-HCH transport system substrate-binding protein
MKESRIINAGVGALLLLAAVSTLFIAFYASTPDWKEYQGYGVYANFDEAAGLRARAPIRIAGVQVGEVESVTLTDLYQARVKIRMHSSDLLLSRDTSAHIFTEGLLGVRYIALFPGYDEELLEDNSEIEHTSSGFVLENLIGQVMISAGLSNDNESSGS